LDKFPEASRRFEKRVDTSRIKSFDHLQLTFSWWAKKQWTASKKQVKALRVEARRIGIISWRPEKDTLGRIHYRDLLTGRFIRRPEE